MEGLGRIIDLCFIDNPVLREPHVSTMAHSRARGMTSFAKARAPVTVIEHLPQRAATVNIREARAAKHKAN
eukprot:4810556-Amphidinium_carterae.1